MVVEINVCLCTKPRMQLAVPIPLSCGLDHVNSLFVDPSSVFANMGILEPTLGKSLLRY